MKQKNFLVTGGSGFIGAAIVNYLSSLGKNVVVFDNNIEIASFIAFTS